MKLDSISQILPTRCAIRFFAASSIWIRPSGICQKWFDHQYSTTEPHQNDTIDETISCCGFIYVLLMSVTLICGKTIFRIGLFITEMTVCLTKMDCSKSETMITNQKMMVFNSEGVVSFKKDGFDYRRMISYIILKILYRFRKVRVRTPPVKLKIPGKAFLKSESRTSVTLKL